MNRKFLQTINFTTILAIGIFSLNGCQHLPSKPEEKIIEKSSEIITAEKIKPTQETRSKAALNTTQEAVKIDLNKIVNHYSQAPHYLKFEYDNSRESPAYTDAAMTISDEFMISTLGNDDNNLDSAMIIPFFSFEEEKSNIDRIMNIVGEFAAVIDQNIVANDKQLLKSMLNQLENSPGFYGDAERIVDGLTLTMHINPNIAFSDPSQGLSLLIQSKNFVPANSPSTADIGILSHTLSKDGLWGSWDIHGELINNSQKNITDVRITATLYDSNNKVIIDNDRAPGMITSGRLEPGDKSQFVIYIDNPPKNYDHYELAVTKVY